MAAAHDVWPFGRFLSTEAAKERCEGVPQILEQSNFHNRVCGHLHHEEYHRHCVYWVGKKEKISRNQDCQS